MTIKIDDLHTDRIVLREFRGFDEKKLDFWDPDYLTPYYSESGFLNDNILESELMQSNAWNFNFWEPDMEKSNFWESPVWLQSDAKQIADLAQHEKFQGFYAFPPKGSPEEAFRKAAIALVMKALILRTPDATTNQRENYKLAVTHSSNKEKILGYIALDEINEERGEYRDIGFFSHPDIQCQGYTTDASRLVLKAFFENTDYDDIYITYHPNNIGSRRVAEHLGYKKVQGKYFLMVNGRREPREKCKLTKEDFYDHLPFNFC